MTHRLFTFASIPLALFVLGCKNEVSDTEGRTFTFECKSGTCSLTETSDKDDDDQKSERSYIATSEGRVLLVCPAEKAGFECRPLSCETSAPCSRLGGSDFTCEKSLCQAPSRPFIPADKLALCLAKTGAWKRTPEQLERLTLTRACTGDCVLPAVCLKP